MCEPGQYPGDDEYDEICLPKAFENPLEFRVFGNEERQDHRADELSKFSYIIGEEVSKVGLPWFLQKIVSLVVAE